MQRGNKLWEGHRMILPEHRKAMLDYELHQEQFVERPVLDEDTLEEMQQAVQEAMERGRMVTLKVYDRYGIREITMNPKWLDHSGKLKGYAVDGAIQAVDVTDIVGIVGE